MLPEYCAIIGAIIGSLGGFYYLYETIVGRAQPNRITWLLWGIFPMVIFVAQRAQGVEGISWASFVAGFTPLIIVAASFFNKNAYWKSEPRDYYLMAAAIVGIIRQSELGLTVLAAGRYAGGHTDAHQGVSPSSFRELDCLCRQHIRLRNKLTVGSNPQL
jgi:hypothetical protein